MLHVCGGGMRLRRSRHGTEILKECLLLWLHRAGVSPRGLSQSRTEMAFISFLPLLFLSQRLYSSVSVMLEILQKEINKYSEI